MIVLSKRNIVIPSPDGTISFRLSKDEIKDIPAWAVKTKYFQALVNDGKIIVTASTKEKEVTAAVEKELKPERAKKKVKKDIEG